MTSTQSTDTHLAFEDAVIACRDAINEQDPIPGSILSDDTYEGNQEWEQFEHDVGDPHLTQIHDGFRFTSRCFVLTADDKIEISKLPPATLCVSRSETEALMKEHNLKERIEEGHKLIQAQIKAAKAFHEHMQKLRDDMSKVFLTRNNARYPKTLKCAAERHKSADVMKIVKNINAAFAEESAMTADTATITTNSD